jgi:hypothetical protein
MIKTSCHPIPGMGRYEGADLFSVRCFGINKINIKAKALA